MICFIMKKENLTFEEIYDKYNRLVYKVILTRFGKIRTPVYDVEDLKVPPPKLIPAVPIAPAAPQREISGKGDGATSSWIIPLDD